MEIAHIKRVRRLKISIKGISCALTTRNKNPKAF